VVVGFVALLLKQLRYRLPDIGCMHRMQHKLLGNLLFNKRKTQVAKNIIIKFFYRFYVTHRLLDLDSRNNSLYFRDGMQSFANFVFMYINK
jgi:hypothetical protein